MRINKFINQIGEHGPVMIHVNVVGEVVVVPLVSTNFNCTFLSNQEGKN
jgi:hypothetical protein